MGGRNIASFDLKKGQIGFEPGFELKFLLQTDDFFSPGEVRAVARLPAAQRRLTVWPICQ